MTFSRNNSVGYLINHLARLFSDSLQKEIKPLGLSTGVFPIMLHLWETDGLTQKELVEQVGIEQATMTNTLNRMERDGLVERKKGTKDARLRLICLTSFGKSLSDPATQIAAKQNFSLLQGLSKAEQRQLIGLMDKLVESIENRNDWQT